MSQGGSPTRTLPPRAPEGFWRKQPRYRSYVLFAATGGVLAAVNGLLLWGLRALAHGVPAWTAYLDRLGSAAGLFVVLLLLVGTLFFSLRWLRVGATIPAVQLGPLPAPAVGLVRVMHYLGLVTISATLLIVLSGIVV